MTLDRDVLLSVGYAAQIPTPAHLMRIFRTSAVFAGVVTVGAALGAAIVAAAVTGYTVLRYQAWYLEGHASYYTAALLVGAGLGGLLAAATAFGPLRHAPIGRLFGWTAVGTTLGVLSGLATGGATPLILGIAGFFAGALHVERKEWLAGRLPGAAGTVSTRHDLLSK